MAFSEHARFDNYVVSLGCNQTLQSSTFPSQACIKLLITVRLKPIFHCNAKPLVLGRRIGLDPQRDHFALEIPTCCYLKSLADPTRIPMDPTLSLMDPTRVIITQCETQRKPVEYGSRWVCKGSDCVVCPVFFALATQHERNFQLE